MTVLVTGGAGFIGSHMVLSLIEAGEEVIVLDNLSTGFRFLVPKDAVLVVGDVGDQELLQVLIKKFQINAVLHFAGSIIVPESVSNPLLYYNNNTVKSRALIEIAVRMGVKHFIFSSTAAVYGTPQDKTVSETSATMPVSPYGTSKLMTEMMLSDCSYAHNFKYIALRYFNVAGADPLGRSGQSTPKATHLIKVASETALGRRPYMEVFGTDYPTRDGTCIRDYIHVSDLIHAHSLALDYLRSGGNSEIFNCGYSFGFTVYEVINAVKKISGKNFEIHLSNRRLGDPPSIVADSQKIRKILGWQPSHDNLEKIVSHALNWEKKLPLQKPNNNT